MKLYSPHHILQQKLANAKTLKDIQTLCEQFRIRVEIQILPSVFSNLTWKLPSNDVTGTFVAHILTTLFDESSEKTYSSLTPTTALFEAIEPTKKVALETAVVQAIQESLRVNLEKLLA